MPFQYKKIVVVGATSGIGKALAERFVSEGSFVIAVGRRKENLEELTRKHGQDRLEAAPLDITAMETIPNFVSEITKRYPDIDCVMLNSGIQRKCDFSDPDSIDLDTINLEFITNYLSFLALTKAFLPFLQERKTETALVYVSSALAMVPLPRVANYCATKAALHQFILCLREQLRPWPIKVIEVYPPAVQTELHDEKHQPDLKNGIGRRIGMPLDEFTKEAYEGLALNSEQIPIGPAAQCFNAFEITRQEIFGQMTRQIMDGKQ